MQFGLLAPSSVSQPLPLEFVPGHDVLTVKCVEERPGGSVEMTKFETSPLVASHSSVGTAVQDAPLHVEPFTMAYRAAYEAVFPTK